MVKYLVVVTILAKVVQKCKFLQKSFFYFFEVVFFFRSDLSYVCKSAVVNTQFRAYPFYKASEWMPHKKLLLNSIVF